MERSQHGLLTARLLLPSTSLNLWEYAYSVPDNRDLVAVLRERDLLETLLARDRAGFAVVSAQATSGDARRESGGQGEEGLPS